LRIRGEVGNFRFMNPPRVQPEEYIDFLIATPKACRATEAARVQPLQPRPPAHDAFTRLLLRLEPDVQTLWQEARTQVALTDGVLVLDDSTLDKPYAKAIELVGRHGQASTMPSSRGLTLCRCSGPMATATSPATTASTTMPRRPPRMTISAPCSRRPTREVSSRVAYSLTAGTAAWKTSNCCERSVGRG
jgi:hypothetical protein